MLFNWNPLICFQSQCLSTVPLDLQLSFIPDTALSTWKDRRDTPTEMLPMCMWGVLLISPESSMGEEVLYSGKPVLADWLSTLPAQGSHRWKETEEEERS